MVVQIRTLTDCVFLHAFDKVDCAAEFVRLKGTGGGREKHVHLALVGAGARESHLPCDHSSTELTWACDAFEASTSAALFVDVIVRDEHMGVVAALSRLVSVSSSSDGERRGALISRAYPCARVWHAAAVCHTDFFVPQI